MRKLVLTVIAALGLVAAAVLPANAVEFDDADLSGGSPNVGDRVEVGSVDLGDGRWVITAGALMFVADPDEAQKNSQGCGLYADGEQLAGAGGSSSGWTVTDDGKTKQLDLSADVVLDEPTTITLVCFIDASHSGVTFEDREGMEARDVFIDAVRFGQSVSEDVRENGGPPSHATN